MPGSDNVDAQSENRDGYIPIAASSAIVGGGGSLTRPKMQSCRSGSLVQKFVCALRGSELFIESGVQ